MTVPCFRFNIQLVDYQLRFCTRNIYPRDLNLTTAGSVCAIQCEAISTIYLADRAIVSKRLNRLGERRCSSIDCTVSFCRRVINANDAKPPAVRGDSGNSIRFLLDPDPILPIDIVHRIGLHRSATRVAFVLINHYERVGRSRLFDPHLIMSVFNADGA